MKEREYPRGIPFRAGDGLPPAPAPSRILFVEDDAHAAEGVSEILSDAGYEPLTVRSYSEGRRAVLHDRFDLLLTDVRLPDGDGLELARESKRRHPDIPVIVVTAWGSIRAAVEAMRDGVENYLAKPIDFDELRLALDRALEGKRLREENRRLREELAARFGFENLVGRSASWIAILETARLAAETEAAVLLAGESGTGKELLAHALHRASPRREGPFVAINCAAIPGELLENELFGHEPGAFTGAVRRRKGLLESADGGTLLLDEIGDMPPMLQAKLLRVIEEKRFSRLGSTGAVFSDFRVIAATHRNLPALVREGRFREDLYFRLNVLALRIPPLRERSGDVALLLEFFLERTAAERNRPRPLVSVEALKIIEAHSWPGNVRELENFAERISLLFAGEELTAGAARAALETLSPEPGDEAVAEREEEPAAESGTLPGAVQRLEARLIREALEETKGNRTRAAAALGISLRALQYKMKLLGIS